MGTNILNIGKSALAAAQLGIATAGHNIANSKPRVTTGKKCGAGSE